MASFHSETGLMNGVTGFQRLGILLNVEEPRDHLTAAIEDSEICAAVE